MYKIILLGRPNVGKSTLFNRLIRSNRAITHDRAGITRDRMEGRVRNKFHRPFILVDTGGITLDSHAVVADGPQGIRGFEKEILQQAEDAISEASGLCLVVDGRDGLTPFDEHLANYLRRLGKPILLVVNKVDGMEREDIMCADFHSLGFDMVAVSAEHGNQIRYLESLMVDMLPETPDYDEEDVMNEVEETQTIYQKAQPFPDEVEKDGKKRRGRKGKEEEIESISFNVPKQEDEFEIGDDFDEDFLVDFNEEDFDGEDLRDFDADFDGEADGVEADEDFDEIPFTEEEAKALLEAEALNEEDSLNEENKAPKEKKEGTKESVLKICLLGRPNAGKSSILNAFVGRTRMIVSDEAGTTRDSVDVPIMWEGRKYVFVDTAGVRRRTKISDTVERYSVNSSLKSTTKADVTFLVIDALQGLTAQDKRLVELLDERKTPFLIILNKMDLVPPSARKALEKQFGETLAFCHHVPVMPTSARNRYGLKMLLPMAEQIKRECYVRIGTGQLNRAMDAVLTKHQPPVVKRVRPKFYYLTQAESQPPTFVFFVNDAERVGESYVRYMEKSLRRMFKIEHAPMRVHLRSSHTKNSEKRAGTKKKAIVSAEQVAEQSGTKYIDQSPQRDDAKKEKLSARNEKRTGSGKATAKGKNRTTQKAALRNPHSPQSRSLKKTMRKKNMED